MRRSLRRLVVLASIFALLGATVPVATAAPPAACANRNNNTIAKLLECVDVAGVREHQAAFQAIADANGRDQRLRAHPAMTPRSTTWWSVWKRPVIRVTVDEFAFHFFSPPTLQQTAPITATDDDRLFSPSQRDLGPSRPRRRGDVVLALPRDPVTSGCEAADFAGFTPGNIALVQPGHLHLRRQGDECRGGQASAAIIYNKPRATRSARSANH